MKNRIVNYRPTDSFSTADGRTYTINPQADNMYQLAELQSFRNTLKAALAKQALSNAAILANAEEFYIRIAPQGRNDYRRIVESYVTMCINEIMGGDR